MQEGRGRVMEEGPQLRTPAGAGSHHQMAVPKMQGSAHGGDLPGWRGPKTPSSASYPWG